MNDLWNFIRQNLFDPANALGAVFWAIVFLLAAVILARLIRRGAHQIGQHLSDKTGLQFISAFGQVLVYLVAFILYARLVPELRELGTTILAGVSLISIVVGFAAQNTLGNLVAGFVLVLYRPVRVGDRVQLTTPRGLAEATVHDISLGYTLLHDDDKNEVVVPNSVLANAVMIRMKEEKT